MEEELEIGKEHSEKRTEECNGECTEVSGREGDGHTLGLLKDLRALPQLLAQEESRSSPGVPVQAASTLMGLLETFVSQVSTGGLH